MDTTTTSPTVSTDAAKCRRRGRVSNALLWIGQSVAALSFVFAALGKFTGSPQVVAVFHEMGVGNWFPYTIGVLEIVGAVALLIPRLSGLAALAFCALMTGATITMLALEPLGVGAPLAPLILCALITWGRWYTVTDLVALVRGRRHT